MDHSENFYQKQFIIITNLINDNNCTNISYIVNLIKKHFSINNFLIKIKDDEILLEKFIVKCDIQYELFKIIKNKIIKRCVGKYKCKYCIEYKLILILHLLNDFSNWKAITKSIFYEPLLNVKNHYKNIYRQYKHWCLKNIFKNAFYELIPIDNNNITNLIKDNMVNQIKENDISKQIKEDNDNFYNVDHKTDLFIDATYIFNKNGSEDVIVNPELTKKNATKLSTLSDVDGFIMSVSLSKANTKEIKYGKKIKKIKTASNDTELVQDLLNASNPNIEIHDNCNYSVIGDKGYKTKKNFMIHKEKITIITPNKKNQKNNLINRHQKNKLKYRFIIENSINGFKHNSRISIRKDRKSLTFMGWVYISCLSYNIKVNTKKEKVYKDNF